MKAKGSLWKSGYRKWVWWVLGFAILVVGGVVMAIEPGTVMGDYRSFPWEITEARPAKLDKGVPVAGGGPRITVENAAEVRQLAMLGNGYPLRTTWSPDGKYFIVTTSIGIDVYDGRTYQQVGSHRCDEGIISVVFSPTAEIVGVGTMNGHIFLWRLADGGLERAIFIDQPMSDVVRLVTFSTDGKYLLGSTYSGIHIWQVENGKHLAHIYGVKEPISAILFTPESGKAVGLMVGPEEEDFDSQSENAVLNSDLAAEEITDLGFGLGDVYQYVVWDFSLGEEPVGGDQESQFLALGEIISTYFEDGIRIFQVPAGEIPVVRPSREEVQAISANELLLVREDDAGIVQVLSNVEERITREPWMISELVISEKNVTFLSISPDNGTVGIIYDDRTIDLWRLSDGRVHSIQGYEEIYTNVAFYPQPGGEIEDVGAETPELISGSVGGSFQFWRVLDGYLFVTGEIKPHPREKMVVSSEGQWAAIRSGGSFCIWQIPEIVPGIVPEIVLEKCYTCQTKVVIPSIALSPDDAVLITDYERLRGSSDDPEFYAIRMWRAADGKLLRQYRTDSEVMSLAISPDGLRVAAGERERQIKVWTDGKPVILETPREMVISVAFSPDGRLLAAGQDGYVIQIWDMENGGLVRSMDPETKFPFFTAYSLVFSPDGRILAAGGDGRVLLWEVADGRLLATLKDPPRQITNLVFSPGGYLLVSTSTDGTLRFWGVP